MCQDPKAFLPIARDNTRGTRPVLICAFFDRHRVLIKKKAFDLS